VIYDHYWIGHYLDPEGALWVSHLSWGHAVVRFWQELCTAQLGAAFWAAGGAAVFVLGAGVRAANRSAAVPPAEGADRWPREAAVLGAMFVLGPAVVLPLQNQPFVVVLGVAVPGVVVLGLALCANLRLRIAGRMSDGAAAKFSSAAAAATFAVGAGYFVARQTAAPYDADFAASNLQVSAITDRIFAGAKAGGLAQPRVAVDQVADYFAGQILSVVCYERHQVWIPFIGELPTGLIAVPESEVMANLASSDFVIASEDGAVGPWPFDREMLGLRPKVLAWCDANLRLVEHFNAFGRRMALYQSRRIPVP